jgi:hypothetical protein
MSISELFRYRNDSFESDIFSSDIGITDVDVGCPISPTLRSMSMPTYGFGLLQKLLVTPILIIRYLPEANPEKEF